jgi:ribonuclease HI
LFLLPLLGTIHYMKEIFLYTDGGARGNPGIAGCGAVIFDEKGATVKEGCLYLGETTNNVAEYQAVLLGFRLLAKHFGRAQCPELYLTVRLDSELVQKQINGVYRVKHPDLKPLHTAVKKVQQELFPRAKFEHVRREKNKHADRLANEAMDTAPHCDSVPVPTEPLKV